MSAIGGVAAALAWMLLWRPLHGRGSPGLGVGISARGLPPRLAVARIASLVRSGLPPDEAWARVAGCAAPRGLESLPLVRAALTRSVRPGLAAGGRRMACVRSWGGVWAERKHGEADEVEAAAVGAVVATAVSRELGAELAPTLDAVCLALGAGQEARHEREATLAGPRATARLLAWLPVAALGLGALLGIDAAGAFADGGVGTLAGGLGLVCTAAGQFWTRHLVSRAARAGTPGVGAAPGDGRPARRRWSGPAALRLR